MDYRPASRAAQRLIGFFLAAAGFAFTLSAPADMPVALGVSYFTAGSEHSHADAEPAFAYSLVPPVAADVLNADPNTHVQAMDARYFMSVFGPRFKSVSSSNVGYFDFHQGSDITPDVIAGGVTYDEDSPPPIVSMCAGEVDEVIDGTDSEMEQLGTGRSLQVLCDEAFAVPGWGQIIIAYRHLGAIEPGLPEGARIGQGQLIGPMGASGHTSNVHLHLSVRRRDDNGTHNVHPLRLFDPATMPHLLTALADAEVWQLERNANDILFRIVVPHSMAQLLTLTLTGPAYETSYDFEHISEVAEDERDQNNFIAGAELFAYPFNRGLLAYQRYIWDMEDMPEPYPASPLAATNSFYPMARRGLFDTPAYVLDVRFSNLPANYDPADFTLTVRDVFGAGLRASASAASSPDVHLAFAPIVDDEQDGEEFDDGEVTLTDGDLEMVDNGSNGHQLVALQFHDLRIPAGAEVIAATVQFTADEDDDEATTLDLYLENSTVSAPLSDADFDFSSRGRGMVGQRWEPEPWTTVGRAGGAEQTASFAASLSELVSQPGWSPTSPLTLLVSGLGKRVADARRAGSTTAPYFEASYRVPSEPAVQTAVLLSAPDVLTGLAGHTFGIEQSGPEANIVEVEYLIDGAVVATRADLPLEADITFAAPGAFSVSARTLADDGVLRSTDAVVVNVAADTDGDGMSDDYETNHGLNPAADDAGGDADGDGVTNIDEFLAGTSASDTNDPPPPTPSARLANLSARAFVGTGDDVLIGGLIIEGDEPMDILLRARGPGLDPALVPEPEQLQDPVLQLFSGPTLVATNDNWTTLAPEDIPPGMAPEHDNESALRATLAPGAHTVIVSGVAAGTGVGIVEIFALGESSSRLSNLSARARVLTGDEVLIGGMIIEGDGDLPVILRATGPGISPDLVAVEDQLADPWLQVFEGANETMMGDDWAAHASAAQIPASHQPAHAKEAAVFGALAPGGHTAIVRGVGDATGVALVEVFLAPE